MNVAAKDRAARAGDWSPAAAGARLRAAVMAFYEDNQAAFARASGQKATALNNSMQGRSMPSLQSMQTLYRSNRVDPTFILSGDYGQLSSDVQAALFAALEALASGSDRRSG